MTRRTLWLWSPLALLLALSLFAAWLVATESGFRWSYMHVRQWLPGTLEADDIGGRLIGPVRARGLRYTDAKARIQIDDFVFDWSPLSLLIGRVDIQQLSAHGIHVALVSDRASTASSSVSFPFRLRVQNLSVSDIHFERNGQSASGIETIEFIGAVNDNRLNVERFRLRTSTADVSAHGAIRLSNGTDQLTLEGRYTDPTVPPIAVRGEIRGNLSDLSIDLETTEPVSAKAHVKATDVLSNLTWRADLTADTVDLHQLKPAWRGHLALNATANGDRERFQGSGTMHGQYTDLPAVSGKFDVVGSTEESLTLKRLIVTVPGTTARLSASGNWRFATKALRANVQWENLQWPMKNEPTIISPSGRLDASGTLSKYDFTIQTITEAKQLPRTTWQASGSGDLSHVSLNHIELQTLDGTAEGTGRFDWSPRLYWDVAMNGKGFNPGIVWNDWQGNVAFDLHAAGDATEIRAELVSLSGRLRDRPLKAKGQMTRHGNDFPLIRLDASSGNATASVRGDVRRTWNLSWQINAPDLAAVLPHAAGNFRGEGRITGKPESPLIEMKLTGSTLAYEALHLRQLAANIHVDFADQEPSRVNIDAADLTWNNYQFEQLRIVGDGRVGDHRIQFDTHKSDNAFHAQLDGAYRNGLWQGKLTESHWNLSSRRWTQNRATPMQLARNRIELNNICWNSNTSQLCAQLQTSANDGSLTVGAQNLPLGVLGTIFPAPIELRGRVDGNADVRWQAGRLAMIEGQLAFAAGSVRLPSTGAATTFAYERATLDVHLRESGLTGNADIRLANGDGATAEITLPKFLNPPPKGDDQPVNGRLRATFKDLAPLAALLPEVDQLRGALQIDLAFGGTLLAPHVQGSANLTEATARIPALNIQLRDVRLIATPDGQALRLNGFARSGDGELALSGRLDFGTHPPWRLEIRIAGAQFQVANLKEADVRVSPDLRAFVSPGSIRVQGDVFIPQARFAPQPRRKTVEASPDVVVETTASTKEQRRAAWDLNAEIKVTLGNNVTFQGFGLAAAITGSVTLFDTSTQVTTARGELNVTNGKYEAYGQNLEVERGRLLFAGGPVDDPGIDARAFRRIESVVAGLEVRGTLKTPQLTVFSDPAMSQADALSYLLFGKPVDTANATQGAALAAATRALKMSGGEYLAQRVGERLGIEEVEIGQGANSEAALVLGKRLSPRLYINYSIGLVEPINVFRIRYQLTTHWILQAESGKNWGGDLLYTIER